MSRRRQMSMAEGKLGYKAKRNAIMDTASLLFKEKGYKSTTLADIAERTGMDRATLYHYVGSKEQIFQESIQEACEKNAIEAYRVSRDDSRTPQEKIEQLVEALMCSFEEHYPQMFVYIQEDMQQIDHQKSEWSVAMAKQQKQVEGIFFKVFEDGIAQGHFRGDIPPVLLANALFGMFNWTHRWFKPGKRSAKEIARFFCDIFFNGALAVPATSTK